MASTPGNNASEHLPKTPSTVGDRTLDISLQSMSKDASGIFSPPPPVLIHAAKPSPAVEAESIAVEDMGFPELELISSIELARMLELDPAHALFALPLPFHSVAFEDSTRKLKQALVLYDNQSDTLDDIVKAYRENEESKAPLLMELEKIAEKLKPLQQYKSFLEAAKVKAVGAKQESQKTIRALQLRIICLRYHESPRTERLWARVTSNERVLAVLKLGSRRSCYNLTLVKIKHYVRLLITHSYDLSPFYKSLVEMPQEGYRDMKAYYGHGEIAVSTKKGKMVKWYADRLADYLGFPLDTSQAEKSDASEGGDGSRDAKLLEFDDAAIEREFKRRKLNSGLLG